MKTELSLEDIYAPIQADLARVEQQVVAILKAENPLSNEVIRHFLQARGKLLRPALCLLGASFGPILSDTVLRTAAALEIFHSATLIHDDIIDSSYLRRNVPTVNAVWGPQVAVLVGDYLHDKAIGAVFESKHDRAIAAFLETAGVVCDGEILELSHKNNFAMREEDYITVIERKTASLLASCLEIGGLLADLPEEQAAALKRYGLNFGIAFQIVDDLLDFTGRENEFGKTLGADLAAGVLTLPLIHALSTADEKAKEKIIAIVRSDKNVGTRHAVSLLSDLIQCLEEQDSLAYSYQRAKEYAASARAELDQFEEGDAKRSLDLLLSYVLERHR